MRASPKTRVTFQIERTSSHPLAYGGTKPRDSLSSVWHNVETMGRLALAGYLALPVPSGDNKTAWGTPHLSGPGGRSGKSAAGIGDSDRTESSEIINWLLLAGTEEVCLAVESRATGDPGPFEVCESGVSPEWLKNSRTILNSVTYTKRSTSPSLSTPIFTSTLARRSPSSAVRALGNPSRWDTSWAS